MSHDQNKKPEVMNLKVVGPLAQHDQSGRRQDVHGIAVVHGYDEYGRLDYGYDEMDMDDKIHELEWKRGDVMEITSVVSGKTKCTHAMLDMSDDVSNDVVGLDSLAMLNLGVKPNDPVSVRRVKSHVANMIKLSPLDDVANQDLKKYMDINHKNHAFTKDDFVPIMTWPNGKTWFVVSDMAPDDFGVVGDGTEFVMGSTVTDLRIIESAPRSDYDRIGGMDEQIKKIREMIEIPMWHPEILGVLEIEPPRGILIHGPPGTGKTRLARAIARESNAEFREFSGPEVVSKWVGDTEKNLRDKFRNASGNKPLIILIDEIDSIAPKREGADAAYVQRMVAQILTIMDGIGSMERTVVIATTNMPDSIDPALRRPGRFDQEIEIKMPDEEGRAEILKIHTAGIPVAGVDMKAIARLTPGYTGADLAFLCREAVMRAIRRIPPILNLLNDEDERDDGKKKGRAKEYVGNMTLVQDDFTSVLADTTPSGLRGLAVEVPNVTWDQVGGLDRIKSTLHEIIDWPVMHRDDVERFGVRMPHGILLHGPPGTGKTLIAKAIATTSKYNFISVKGPELLSRWVGESEKGIRHVFKKARQSSPCIIFFDEIDALAPRRSEKSGNHVMESVVSQLLTEIDGIEGLRDVIVIGATNRPDIIDRALLRSGRLDRIEEVPKPNAGGREHILKIHMGDKPAADDVDLWNVANETDGFSGADLESVVQRAATSALRRKIGGDKESGGAGGGDGGAVITNEDLKDAMSEVKRDNSMRNQ